jgi:hypothetical protein
MVILRKLWTDIDSFLVSGNNEIKQGRPTAEFDFAAKLKQMMEEQKLRDDIPDFEKFAELQVNFCYFLLTIYLMWRLLM